MPENELIPFGEFVRQERLRIGLSLRAFCQKYGEDPSNWSKMERGLLRPPSSATRLLQIAQRIGIAEEEESKQKLFDLASAGNGQVPPDIMTEKQLVATLPFVFRTLRGDTPSEAELLKLADLIRETRTPKNEEAK